MAAQPPTPDRFRALYEEYHRAIYAYFLRRTDRDAAEDCTGEVFAVLWRRADKCPDGDAARLWLYGIARNVLTNHRRSKRRRVGLIDRLTATAPGTGLGADEIAFANNERSSVLDALARLSAQDREILQLAYWEEFAHRDIGELLGCSVGAVDVRLHRARRRFAKGFAQSGHERFERPVFLAERREEEC